MTGVTRPAAPIGHDPPVETPQGFPVMRTLAGRHAAAAFWTLLGAVCLIVLAPVAARLVPTVLAADSGNALGILALFLLSVAHALPLIDAFRSPVAA